jgi:hypothetical protein
MKSNKWLWLAAFHVIFNASIVSAADITELQIVGTISSSEHGIVLLYNPASKRTTAVSPGASVPGFPGYQVAAIEKKSVLVKDSKGTSIHLTDWVAQDNRAEEEVAEVGSAPISNKVPDKPLVIVDTYKWIRDVGLLKEGNNSEKILKGEGDESPDLNEDQSNF